MGGESFERDIIVRRDSRQQRLENIGENVRAFRCRRRRRSDAKRLSERIQISRRQPGTRIDASSAVSSGACSSRTPSAAKTASARSASCITTRPFARSGRSSPRCRATPPREVDLGAVQCRIPTLGAGRSGTTAASNRVRAPPASTVTAETVLTRSRRGSGPVVVNASATNGRLTSGSSFLVTGAYRARAERDSAKASVSSASCAIPFGLAPGR